MSCHAEVNFKKMMLTAAIGSSTRIYKSFKTQSQNKRSARFELKHKYKLSDVSTKISEGKNNYSQQQRTDKNKKIENTCF